MQRQVVRRIYITSNRLCSTVANKSSLSISGNRANEHFRLLNPYIDFDSRLENHEKLREDLRLRHRNVNIDSLVKFWTEYKELTEHKKLLENQKLDIEEKIGTVSTEDASGKETFKNLVLDARKLSKSIKETTKAIWQLEDHGIVRILDLPNDLHRSNYNKQKINMAFFSVPKFSFVARSHMELGDITSEIGYTAQPIPAFYPRNTLAILELSCANFICDMFKEMGFIRHSNPDFGKGVAVEGCGINIHDRDELYILQAHEANKDSNAHYLIGGASLPSFISFFAKRIVKPESLPQKAVTFGRIYRPAKSPSLGLFGSGQMSCVSACLFFPNNKSIEEELTNDVLQILMRAYTRLNIHFKVQQELPHNLRSYETVAFSVRMFSPFLQEYHEVGRISLCGTYISKRLYAMQRHDTTSASFLSVIYVQAIDLTKWLGLMTECNQFEDGSYSVPKCLEAYNYGIACKYS